MPSGWSTSLVNNFLFLDIYLQAWWISLYFLIYVQTCCVYEHETITPYLLEIWGVCHVCRSGSTWERLPSWHLSLHGWLINDLVWDTVNNDLLARSSLLLSVVIICVIYRKLLALLQMQIIWRKWRAFAHALLFPNPLLGKGWERKIFK